MNENQEPQDGQAPAGQEPSPRSVESIDPEGPQINPARLAEEPQNPETVPTAEDDAGDDEPPARAFGVEATASEGPGAQEVTAEAAEEIEPPEGLINSERPEYSPFRSYEVPEDLATTPFPVEDDATAAFSQAELLARERAERKAARERALGNVARTPEPEPTPQPVIRSTDKFAGSLGLFLLRLVVATIFGVRAIQNFTDLQTTSDLIASTWIPEPGIMAIVLCAGEFLIALGLIFGLATRIAGAGVAIIAVSSLVFVHWGVQSLFVGSHPGFVGEYELVLAAVGFVLLFVGGGGWAFDRQFRRNRQRTRATGDR